VRQKKQLEKMTLGEQTSVKETSYEYGQSYQREQIEKYRNRANNHWKFRIELANRLTEEYVLPRFGTKPVQDIVVTDVGTSIGTFAIEFAKRRFRTFGIDFDEEALKIARQLAADEKVSPTFMRADVADWPRELPSIDIAICFDIFEHLHDDELGAFLTAIRKNLSADGCLVFHTFPLQYDYLIYGRRLLRAPLYPFAKLPERWFNRILRSYAALFDQFLLMTRGVDYRDTIRTWSHCNPTTEERMSDILQRAGYELIFMESAQLYPYFPDVARRFSKQRLAHRNLYGVAAPRRA
jgi:2-polyprenyl-3-methyl-5-hydroxy-6-metoxy-1,4-benzoquinol methylase